MPLRIAVATIAVCPLIFALFGAGIGWLLGASLPGYYRAVFCNGLDPRFDPLEAGVGLGFTQGFAGGIAVGIILVAIFVWRDVQMARLAAQDAHR